MTNERSPRFLIPPRRQKPLNFEPLIGFRRRGGGLKTYLEPNPGALAAARDLRRYCNRFSARRPSSSETNSRYLFKALTAASKSLFTAWTRDRLKKAFAKD